MTSIAERILLADLTSGWRAKAKLFREHEETSVALAYEKCASALEEVLIREDDVAHTLTHAAQLSGYSAEHLGRLIDLSMLDSGFGASGQPIANLSCYKLRELRDKIDGLLTKGGSKIDPYTVAHLVEAQVRIEKSLDAQYIYNLDDINGGFGGGFIFFQPESESDGRR